MFKFRLKNYKIMENKGISIETLFTDSGPFEEKEVIEVIHPFVTIQRTSNEIFFKEADLTSDLKILIFALTKKLLKHNNLIESEFITAPEVNKKTGLKKGTIDPTIKKLKDNGYLVGKGEYEIPIHKISTIIKQLKNKSNQVAENN
jgi:hypothetical protein